MATDLPPTHQSSARGAPRRGADPWWGLGYLAIFALIVGGLIYMFIPGYGKVAQQLSSHYGLEVDIVKYYKGDRFFVEGEELPIDCSLKGQARFFDGPTRIECDGEEPDLEAFLKERNAPTTYE